MTQLKINPTAPVLPSSPVRFTFHFIKRYWLSLSTLLALELGQAVMETLIPHATRKMIEGLTSNPDAVGNAIQLFVWLGVGILLCSRGSGTVLTFLSPVLRRQVRREIFHYLQHHSHRFFLSNFAGSLANRVSEVSFGVQHAIWTFLFDFWPVMITFTVSFKLLSDTSSELAKVFGIWICAFVGVSFFLAQRCREYAKASAATRSTVTGKVVDAITNIQNTKLFAKLAYERTYLDRYLDAEFKQSRKTGWFMEKMRWFNITAALGLEIGMVVYALHLWRSGALTVGDFAMVASLVLVITRQAGNLSRRFLDFFEYIGNIQDGVQMIMKSHDILDTETPAPMNISRGEIRFEAVEFAYHADQQRLFKNLDVRIAPGSRVGLVGFSGSGKTTFANLILRMMDVNGGKILIDGTDIQTVSQDDLRRQITLIPQEPILFHRSLAENIAYAEPDATREEIIRAAKLAHADEFIREIKEGYDALVGERGVRLSGGQRQRIAIARAILKNAPILLMDEATSSLDSITERAIQNSLTELMKNRTVVVIAHRLSTIAHLDRILVFHQGAIIEDGSHAELLEKNGHYARLWSMQVDGFLPEHDDATSSGAKESHPKQPPGPLDRPPTTPL